LVGTLAAACLTVPLAPKHRCLVALGLLPLFVRPPSVPDATFRITVLDVGQGQSVMVDTARHRLLYDAGPRYLSGFDLGSAVVVPAFRATGRSRLDMLVLSHGDLDHVGGAAAVAMRLRPRATLTGSLTQGFEQALRCRAGTSWQWDGVRFRIIHPDGAGAGSRNDESCVLEVSARGERALIAGDIGASVERALVTRGWVRPATLLVVPHHGSKSSSTVGWVRATRPLWAIVSVGHANRFGHPAPQTVKRYAAVGSCVRTTADAGATIWSSARPHRLIEWRRRAPPYWRVGTSRARAARCM
jgi:competence protein ComEC